MWQDSWTPGALAKAGAAISSRIDVAEDAEGSGDAQGDPRQRLPSKVRKLSPTVRVSLRQNWRARGDGVAEALADHEFTEARWDNSLGLILCEVRRRIDPDARSALNPAVVGLRYIAGCGWSAQRYGNTGLFKDQRHDCLSRVGRHSTQTESARNVDTTASRQTPGYCSGAQQAMVSSSALLPTPSELTVTVSDGGPKPLCSRRQGCF